MSSICLLNKFPGGADCGPPLEKHSAESGSLPLSPSWWMFEKQPAKVQSVTMGCNCPRHYLLRFKFRWLDSITNSMDMNLSKLQEIEEDRGPGCCCPWGHKGLATAYRQSNNKFSVSSVCWLHALTNRSKWPPLLNLPGSKGSWQEETYLISMGDHLTQKYNLKDVRDILTCTQSHCSVQLPTRIAKAGKI